MRKNYELLDSFKCTSLYIRLNIGQFIPKKGFKVKEKANI